MVPVYQCLYEEGVLVLFCVADRQLEAASISNHVTLACLAFLRLLYLLKRTEAEAQRGTEGDRESERERGGGGRDRQTETERYRDRDQSHTQQGDSFTTKFSRQLISVSTMVDQHQPSRMLR